MCRLESNYGIGRESIFAHFIWVTLEDSTQGRFVGSIWVTFIY